MVVVMMAVVVVVVVVGVEEGVVLVTGYVAGIWPASEYSTSPLLAESKSVA